jgi:uncharacterized membrane protein (DUF2068 family)
VERGARPAGLRLILGYKFVKAPVMLALAAALTFAPARAVSVAHHAAFQLSETGALGWRVARWAEPHLTIRVEHRAAALAWLDGASTLAEGLLLLSGTAWGEWIVVAGLALLVPFEALALARRPRIGRAVVLLINLAVVVYLARDRWRHRHVRLERQPA